jgi:hypothetical protein
VYIYFYLTMAAIKQYTEQNIKIKCRKCGRQAPANEFVLDSEYRMVVCPNCIKERDVKNKIEVKAQEQEEVKKRPGWDYEDEYLEKAYKAKKGNQLVFEKVSEDKIKYICPKCKNMTLYNVVKKFPSLCPFCGRKVSLTNTGDDKYNW